MHDHQDPAGVEPDRSCRCDRDRYRGRYRDRDRAALPSRRVVVSSLDPPLYRRQIREGAGAPDSSGTPPLRGDPQRPPAVLGGSLRPVGVVARAGAISRDRSRSRSGAPWIRLAIAAGLILAFGLAWVVLVGGRPGPPSVTAGDPVGRQIEAAVTGSLHADRVLAVTRWAGNVATTLVLGAVIFNVLVLKPVSVRGGERSPLSAASERHVSLVTVAAAAGVVAELAGLPLRAVARSAGGFSAAWDPGELGAILDTRFGASALLRITGLLLVFGAWTGGWTGAWRDEGRPGRLAAESARWLAGLALVAGGLAILASYGLSGHPQAAGSAYLLVPVQCLHVVVVSTWFAGVVLLGIELRGWGTRADELAEVVARFSTVAGVTVAVAAVTGLTLAFSQLSVPADLTASGYGRALVVKLAVLSVPLALGGYNRQRLVPAVRRLDEPRAWRHLRVSLACEALIVALGVLLATAAMTSGGF